MNLVALVKRAGDQWEIIDPFVSEWLRRTTPFTNEPFALLPAPVDEGDAEGKK